MSEKRIPEDVARLRFDLWSARIRQRDAAAWAGISESTLSDFLNGRRPLAADKVATIRARLAELKQ